MVATETTVNGEIFRKKNHPPRFRLPRFAWTDTLGSCTHIKQRKRRKTVLKKTCAMDINDETSVACGSPYYACWTLVNRTHKNEVSVIGQHRYTNIYSLPKHYQNFSND